ncbi:DsbA family oxidoreductase [Bailinhaonella thermotolerans]|uniref:DsbA family oxidoreductase n=1 Tax=Bailinhaonella thermotolerans TaxID=1070861 RepID=A0A3A4AQD4_9ACTN|nr:DsbA family oxidoreductase [Bailinhaonella thermotolerans]RJL30779.1 DsbA family oxidoreductase [Bailinhaonella thermotolerans]
MIADIWFDVACPWCYIGKRNWEEALSRFPGEVETRWRAFELRPGYFTEPGPALREIMFTEWGMTEEEIRAVVERVTRAGHAAGVECRIGEVRPVSTFDAHRLAKLGAGSGLAGEVIERLFRAYHTDLANVADRGLLTELGVAAGLARAEVERLWDGDAYAGEIAADQALGNEAGVTAVPSYRVGGHARARNGALSPGDLLALLRSAAAASG